jgi:hypothetical protein
MIVVSMEFSGLLGLQTVRGFVLGQLGEENAEEIRNEPNFG